MGIRSSEYNAWVAMRQRCNNPNHPEYVRYGGRGIKVSPEWDTYSQFIKDMGTKPKSDYSLERMDNNGNYCKSNCKWETKSVQSFNQRTSKDNSSGIVGVYLEKQTSLWKAYIRVMHKQITLGRYANFFEACCARKSAEIKYYERKYT